MALNDLYSTNDKLTLPLTISTDLDNDNACNKSGEYLLLNSNTDIKPEIIQLAFDISNQPNQVIQVNQIDKLDENARLLTEETSQITLPPLIKIIKEVTNPIIIPIPHRAINVTNLADNDICTSYDSIEKKYISEYKNYNAFNYSHQSIELENKQNYMDIHQVVDSDNEEGCYVWNNINSTTIPQHVTLGEINKILKKLYNKIHYQEGIIEHMAMDIQAGQRLMCDMFVKTLKEIKILSRKKDILTQHYNKLE